MNITILCGVGKVIGNKLLTHGVPLWIKKVGPKEKKYLNKRYSLKYYRYFRRLNHRDVIYRIDDTKAWYWHNEKERWSPCWTDPDARFSNAWFIANQPEHYREITEQEAFIDVI